MQRCPSLPSEKNLAQLALIEWLQAITEFKASYLDLSKTTLQGITSKRSRAGLGQGLESQPAQLLAVMGHELVILNQPTDEPLNFFLLRVRTSRLQRLTHKANQLIGITSQPVERYPAQGVAQPQTVATADPKRLA